MSRLTIIISTFLCLMFSSTTLTAQSFVQLSFGSTELSAFGNAGVAYTGSNSHKLNPATLTFQADQERIAINGFPTRATWPESFSSYFNEFGMYNYSGTVLLNANRVGLSDDVTIGLGYSYFKFSFGEIVMTDEMGNPLGTLKPYEAAHDITIGLGTKGNSQIGFGANLRIYHINLPSLGAGSEMIQASSNHFLFSFGMFFRHTSGTDLKKYGWTNSFGMGITLYNFGSDMEFIEGAEKDEPYTMLRAGLSYKSEMKANNLTTAHLWPMIEMNYFMLDQSTIQWHGAIEVGLYETVMARMGYFIDKEENETFKQSSIGFTVSSVGITKRMSDGDNSFPLTVELSYAKFLEKDYIFSELRYFQINVQYAL